MDHLKEMMELATNSPDGCFVELGVYQGGSAFYLAEIAKEQGRDIYLYDTFAGIPFKDEIDSHQIGDFSETSAEQIKKQIPYAKVVEGVFPQSLVKMPKIAFAHIDCDQYRSVQSACEVLGPMMVKNGIMLFDDVFCLEGATKALMETNWPVQKTALNKAYVRF